MKAYLLTIFLTCVFAVPSFAQQHSADKETFDAIQIEEKLGEKVPVDKLRFKDETGKEVVLTEYFKDQKPVLVSMIYFGCPSLCGFLLNGMTSAMRRLEWTVGDQYRVLTVSIDPSEGPDLAIAKKDTYLDQYRRHGAGKDWHFLTGSEDNIKSLAEALGFGFKYVEETGEYAHSAGIFVLTPEAVLSRVLYGIEFSEQDLKLALLEASNGKVGSVVDKLLLFCFRYDPDSKGYALHAFRVVQAGAGVFVILLIGYLVVFWRREVSKGKS